MARTRTKPREWKSPDLKGRVAVVSGASRGLGRAIAEVLGSCGATVYVTGRTPKGAKGADGVEGSIDDTAEAITARGGRGIAVRCDHTKTEDVCALFDRIQRDEGRLDVCVNNAWSGYEGAGVDPRRFWKTDFDRQWTAMFEGGVRAHLLTAQLAAPLMIPRRSGLIVSTVAWDQGKWLGSAVYDVAKSAIVRFTRVFSFELREHNVASLAVAPGFMRTERVLAHFKIAADAWQTEKELKDSESPEYAARGIASLAADPRVMRFTGEVMKSAELAKRYRFTDVDGRQVKPFVLPPLHALLRMTRG